MAVVLGLLCFLAVAGLMLLSIASALFRRFSGGGYNAGGFSQRREGWGFGWGGGQHHVKHLGHHPKPSGGGFKLAFGGGHKPMVHKSNVHKGGGGAHKKW